jgi:FMN phosphatase YigB (HAD superfamily)
LEPSLSFEAVLFDWRGTLFYELSTLDWLRLGARALGRAYDETALAAMAQRLDAVAGHPELVIAQESADCAVDLNRNAALLHFRLAGLGEDLAEATWARDGDLGTSLPYPDTAVTLARLQQEGMRIAIVSDIHYPLQRHFAAYGLADFVDQYVLSFEFGCQKPDRRLFQAALDRLEIKPQGAVMVGDRVSRDTGGVGLGITTLILPPVPNGAPRGLGAVLALARRSRRSSP